MKNRSFFLIVAIIIFSSFAANAQEKPEKIGIRAGYQSSNWFDTDGAQLGDRLQSFYVGFFKDNKLIPAVHFGIGLEYFQNGYKGMNSNNKQVLHMLSVPVYAKAKIGPVFGLAGIGANLKVSEKIIINDVASSPTSDQKSKTVDFPLFIGAGAKFWIFTVEARYHWGLVAINHGLHNRYLQIGAGVSF